jgi:hypothetical protein
MIRPILTSLLIFVIATTHAAAEAVPVKIVPGVGITRGGEPYFVKGAGGDKHLDELVAAGGNSIRTWTTNGLGPILDAAQQRGLTVCAGIWLEPECNWFSYAKPEHCARQTERVKKEVLQYRDHPALLFWGLGNEAEGDGNNAAYWKQLEVLAQSREGDRSRASDLHRRRRIAARQGRRTPSPHAEPRLRRHQHLRRAPWPSRLPHEGELDTPLGGHRIRSTRLLGKPPCPWDAPIEQTSGNKARKTSAKATKPPSSPLAIAGAAMFSSGARSRKPPRRGLASSPRAANPPPFAM